LQSCAFNRRGALNDRDTNSAQEGEFFSDPLRAAADGEAVLSTTKAQAEADAGAAHFSNGWSYGRPDCVHDWRHTHPELKGLIFQGAGGT